MSSLIQRAAPARRKTFAQSTFCWIDGLVPGRNQFVSFVQKFQLDRVAPARLHLFADTRYRLWVNERFVAYGPGRFVTTAPEYDSHDLAPYLQRGNNVIRVEVNFYGASSFQSMPDGCPGFIADGFVEGTDLCFATPGNWSARIHRAWDEHAPLFSFAQNPAEICDTRLLEQELAGPTDLRPTPLQSGAFPSAHLAPRSVPNPDYKLVRPKHLPVTGPLESRLCWGMQFASPPPNGTDAQTEGILTRFSTWIHVPRAGRLDIDCFWSDLALNGKTLNIEYPGKFGNHGVATAELREGWNFLTGHFARMQEQWAYLIGLPHESGASLHAEPRIDCAQAFACSPPVHEAQFLPCPATPSGHLIPDDWMLRSGSLDEITPSRIVAWDSPVRSEAIRNLPFQRLAEVSGYTARAALWNFDFGDEYYGHPVIEVEAPAGSIMDVAYDDWKRSDGCVNLYHSNPFTDAADRFILRGGRQKIEVLNPRGGIYLQVILRVPAGSPPAMLAVHDVAVRRRTTLNTIEGSFHCGDPLLDWSWKIATHTLQASTDESYADCPWRERASYIGDSLVNFHLHRLASADLSVARRTFGNFGKAQLPDGQLACCAPSWLTRPHEDFTLIWIQAVRDYWAHTGDKAFVTEQWPVIQRIWASPTWKADADDLWDTTGMRVFLDWGALVSEREGPANAAVNILRVAAARACAELANALGHPTESAEFASDAERIAAALCARVWNEAEGRFNASIGAETPAIHANILALYHDIGSADRILAYLEPKLRANFHNGIENGQFTGFAELYFFYYLLPALVAHDRVGFAEELIREHYGFIQSLGYPTLPEYFHDAGSGGGSCCHSWSGAPAIHCTETILGIRLAHPGQPDSWLLDPRSPGHSHAEGTVPHRRGPIHVSWKRRGNRIEANASMPDGINLLPAAHVDLTVTVRPAAV